MKGIAFLPGFISAVITLGIILPVNSQVTSDGTTNTTVNSIGNNFNILNGIQKGNNLFHSFKEFSIPTGGTASFNNSTDVVNIINRVTGGNISNIDGLIKANGSANLFLINPAGIVFGENASLDIGGSFLGSTAESILFEDGFEFTAVNAQTEPLLTISVPLGLQMGSNPGNITVRGNGHRLSTINSFSALETRDTSSGIRVNSGNTLALIGGNLILEGGIVSADGGNIALGAVSNNNDTPVQVNLNNVDTSWTLDYSQVEEFKDINLTKRALVDATGVSSGSIQIQGQTVSLKDASLIALENKGEQPGGDIQINATKSLQLADSPNTDFFNGLMNGIFNDTASNGTGGNIIISTVELLMENGGGLIVNRTFTGTAGGSIAIDSKDINMLGSGTIDAGIIITRTLGAGNSGDVTINTEGIKILNQGFIGAASLALGSAGNVNINAQEKIELTAPDFSQNGIPGIASSALSQLGNAGSLTINTGRLVLRDGMVISSSAFGSGDSGSVIINASEAFEIGGQRIINNPDGTTTAEGGIVRSAAILLSPSRREFWSLPDVLKGNGGNIIINTPHLNLEDNGLITVRNDGIGDAGNLIINAESIFLNNQGGITANTASGEGGNINLNLTSDLILRNNSSINTEADGTGNGGNITINSPVILGLENSDIIANAVEGNGGNINITTQGIFGLEFRDRLTPDSDITASSETGVNGTVEINNITIDPNSGLVELPTLKEQSQQIAAGCSSNNESSFVATGRGGMPQNPTEYVDLNPTWSDIRDLSAFRQQRNNRTVEIKQISNPPAIVEATGFIRNEDGVIELVVLENIPLRNKQFSECSGTNT
ncbi:MAG: filamentous hemagglutinin N-terminal domain-containing protein [Cyanobacteria bacterium J06633_8]